MPIDAETIALRNAARAQAAAIGELIQEAVAQTPEEAVDAFWDELRQSVPVKQIPVPPGISTMSDSDARAFGELILEFGLFKGNRVDAVPLENLSQLQEFPFQTGLKRYLATRRIRAEKKLP